MKTEFTDVSETQKTLTIEIPTDVVDAEINRVARAYTKQARIPGFRPGGIEPVDTPNIKDVALEEGQPLKFTAAVETVPAFDPGDLSSITLRRPPVDITDQAVDDMLQRLRERAARYETVEGRPVADGDAVVLHLDRTGPDGQVDHHDDVTVQLGAPGNPPGLPELDDEFAKDVGEFEPLAALPDRIRTDLHEEAADNARRQVRSALFKQLSQRSARAGHAQVAHRRSRQTLYYPPDQPASWARADRYRYMYRPPRLQDRGSRRRRIAIRRPRALLPRWPDSARHRGALRHALPLLGEAFFVLYDDSYLECDYPAVERAFLASGRPALLTVMRNDEQWDHSNVLCVDGRIVRYSKEHRAAHLRHIDYGLTAMRADVFRGYTDGGALDLARVYEDLAARNELAAYEVSDRFYEIGTPFGLAETRQHLEQAG